eukprot:scaffold2061_cov246-Pinguiococcus_pyrenoidosus.AAC.1
MANCRCRRMGEKAAFHADPEALLTKIRSDADAIDPAAVNFVRFGIACLALLPWLPRGDAADFAASAEGVLEPEKTSLEPEKTSLEPEKTSLEGQWKAAAELGLWMFLGYALQVKVIGRCGEALIVPSICDLCMVPSVLSLVFLHVNQAVGLQYTTASRSCFLLYLNVKIVPLLSAFVFKVRQDLTGRPVGIRSTNAVWGHRGAWRLTHGYRRRSRSLELFCCLLTEALPPPSGPPNIGDFWSLLAAVASAFFILRLDTHINKFASSLSLTAALSFTTTVYCLMWAVVDIVASGGLVAETSQLGTLSQSLAKEIADVATASPSEMLYLGLVATALTSVLQAFGQSKIPPEDAALIYALDPVWGAGKSIGQPFHSDVRCRCRKKKRQLAHEVLCNAGFAYLLLGEQLGPEGFVGAGLITAAAIGSQLLGRDETKAKADAA